MPIYQGTSGSTYFTGNVISKQSKSVLFHATCGQTLSKVAIKFVMTEKDTSQAGQVKSTPQAYQLRELVVLEQIQKIDSPLFVKLLDVIYFESSLGVAVGLVFPLYDMNMLELMISCKDRVTVNHLCYLLLQVAKGIQILHEHGIAHLDIKLENIMVNNWDQIVIIDFGFAELGQPGNLIDRFCGSFAYVSPEQIVQRPYDPFKSDIWSYGVLAFATLTKFLPFDTESDKDIDALFTCILTKDVHYPQFLSPGAKDFLSCMLDRNLRSRATIYQIINHWWFKNEAMYVPGSASNTPMMGSKVFRHTASLNVHHLKVGV